MRWKEVKTVCGGSVLQKGYNALTDTGLKNGQRAWISQILFTWGCKKYLKTASQMYGYSILGFLMFFRQEVKNTSW